MGGERVNGDGERGGLWWSYFVLCIKIDQWRMMRKKHAVDVCNHMSVTHVNITIITAMLRKLKKITGIIQLTYYV